jgi:hypothetical protein
VPVSRNLGGFFVFAAILGIPSATASGMEPISCPAGTPIGSFQVMVTGSSPSAAPRSLQTLNQLLPGYHIRYHPESIKGPNKKKARISVVLVPSDKGSAKGKIIVLDPRPADQDADWTATTQTAIAALIFGPEGLDKGKVASLLKRNDELVGQLADYAQKTQQTEALIQAITQEQQTLDTGQSVNAAVVSFANQYPGAPRLDRTQPVDAQMATLLHGLNPALSSYDPLAPDPTQRAAQSASIAAAVAGLFFGTEVGLGASAGALLLNMHSLFFPRTELRSAFAQTGTSAKNVTMLCGNGAASATRTQIAFLWATRFPDTSAPAISLKSPEHLAIGQKSTVPLNVNSGDWKNVPRIQDWHLVSADGSVSQPLTAKANVENKSIELDPVGAKLKPGPWKLAAMWDWTPINISGDVELHDLSSFTKARVAPASQDRIIQGAGKVLVSLEGDDFEFVDKLSWKNCDDKFAQASPVPFILPKGPRAGPQTSLETQIDTQSARAGNYQFLLAQSDGEAHPVPFKVLPAPPQISNLPVLVNTGEDAHVLLHGKGLDRIESISADGARIALDNPLQGDERGATVTLDGTAKVGAGLTIQVKVKDFDQPIAMTGALVVAGPRPIIQSIRVATPPSAVALAAGEISYDTSVSFEFGVKPAVSVVSVDLYCANTPQTRAITIQSGQAAGDSRLRQEGSGMMFLAFQPGNVGQPGCDIMLRARSATSGDSAPTKLGRIVLLPRIESFQLTDQKASDGAFYGEIKGRNLETIAKTGWDAQTGLATDAIPTPVPDGGNTETLRVKAPWPAPTPHSPLYIWLRGEDKGRATTAKW